MSLIYDNANKVAQIISQTDTDFRGDLLSIISDKLSESGQFYTSDIFRKMAKEYGINKERNNAE